MTSKRILLIIPEMGMGGAQRSMAKLSVELAKYHNVILVVFNQDHPVAYPVGGKVVSLDVVPGPGFIGKGFAFLKRIRNLGKIKRENKIEISISFLEGADYINILSRKQDKIIISIRGSKVHDETITGKFSWLRNTIFIPLLYRFADAIVTVNQGIIGELKNVFKLRKIKICSIGNFYDHSQIDALANEPKPPAVAQIYKQRPVLVISGRLAPEKGIKSLLQIFAQVKVIHTHAALVIVGDGPLYHDLLQECSRLKLSVETSEDFRSQPDVIFLGNQSNVFRFLKDATLYLLNSSSEGFPNSLAEAMICGVPVISSDCPYGPREILAPEFPRVSSVSDPFFSKYGILMPVIINQDDLHIWTQTINNLISQKQFLSVLAASAKERVTVFNKENIMRHWNELISIL